MAEFVNCGFIRSYVLWATLNKNSSQCYDWLIENVTKDFSFDLPGEKKKVKAKFKDYVKHFRKSRIPDSDNIRKRLIDAFSCEKWVNLTEEERLVQRFSG